MGLILLAVLAVITVIALFIMRGASPLFRKLQKLLDRMSAVLLENITGVRAVLDFSPTIQDLTEKKVWFPAASENVVTFKNAAFRFADSEEYTLKGLNFTCKRGATTAIIGGTGSGKSTVASLILRFNDVTDGELLLNNVNIRNCSRRAAPMPRCTTANSHDLIRTEPRGKSRAALSLYELLIWFSLHSPFIPQRWRDTES